MGNVSSMIEQNFPPAPRWSVDQMPDLTGQVMLVTGGNTGIGRETAKALLEKNAKVYIACRCPKRAQGAIEWLRKATNGREPIFLHLDLADLESVRVAVEKFMGQETELHCLFNNGAVFAPPMSSKTAQGYDLQFGTNVLGHYLLTKLLLPMMIRTAKTSPISGMCFCLGGVARIINVSSIQHLFAPKGGVDYASLDRYSDAADQARRKIGPEKLYAQSKWGIIAFSNELARRYADQGIVSIALHPGNVRSEIMRHTTLSGLMSVLAEMVLWDCPYGAITSLYAGTYPSGVELNGKYLVPWARRDEPRHDTHDTVACGRLWDWLEAQVA